MLIRSRNASDLAESQVTPEAIYFGRRQWLQKAGLLATGAAFGSVAGSIVGPSDVLAATGADEITTPMIDGVVPGPFGTTEPKTPYKHVTTYNNFYEFGTDKADPAYVAADFVAKPWSVAIEGEVAKPGVYALEDLVKPHQLEERIYRMRCVEAWSMVIPWVGISLGDLIKRLEPTSKAKYVAFETLHDPDRMPGQRRAVLRWPYSEGLRIDEATHPLTILAVGLYGSELPNQNGAPLRLVVPWKYGFKGIKSIVRIRFVEEMPETSWNISAAREYGFYANVNPQVDHPRWSQARERRIGEFFRSDTQMFNGYGEEVAGLYKGMDLAKNF